MKYDSVVKYGYGSITQYGYGSAIQVQLNGKWGLQQMGGPILIPIVYDSINTHLNHDSASLSFAVVKRSGKTGVVNLNNQMLVPVEYDTVEIETNYSIDNYSIDRLKRPVSGFHVLVDGKWGWYSSDGKLNIKPFAKSKLKRIGFQFTVKDKIKNPRDAIVDGELLGDMAIKTPGWISEGILQEYGISNDSLFALKIVETDSSYRYYTNPYELRKRKPKGSWAFRWERKKFGFDKLFLPQSESTVHGYSFKLSPFSEEIDNDHSFQVNQKRIYSFQKDQVVWNLQVNLGTDQHTLIPSECGYKISYRKEGRTLFAVGTRREPYVDTTSGIIEIEGEEADAHKYNWKVLPQRKYQILDGDFFENALLVAKGNRYGFVDTNLHEKTAFTPQPYMNYFRQSNKSYIIHTLLDSPATFYSLLLPDLLKCSSCKTHQVLSDSAGNVIWRPRKTYQIRYLPDFFSSHKRYANAQGAGGGGAIVAQDSTGATGLFNPYGKVLYPALQFRYKDLIPIDQVGFTATEVHNRNKIHFLNSKGDEWFPGFLITHIASHQEAQILSYPSPCDLGGLVRIFPTGLNDPRNSFFMASDGTVYADDEVLPVEVRKHR